MTEPTTADDYAAAQAHEYGQWTAAYPIDYDGARAFNPGDPVPASHVERYGYDTDGLVQPAAHSAGGSHAADTGGSPDHTPEG